MNEVCRNRMKKEMEMFSSAPPSGINCVPTNDRLDALSAQIIGPSETPFEGGTFQLEIQIPDRYPFEPPRIRFLTPIYHPNIDTSGRICLDTLKLPPKGTWRPCLNLSTVLMMIRVLMAEPGSEDPLMADIWQEFRYDFTTYTEKAKQWTRQHAMSNQVCKENVPCNSNKGKSKQNTDGSCHKSLAQPLRDETHCAKSVAAPSKDKRKVTAASGIDSNGDTKKVKLL